MPDFKKRLTNNKPVLKGALKDILAVYTIYYNSIEKLYDKRQNVTSFFLALNTGLVAITGFLFQKDAPMDLKPLYLLIPVAGIIAGFFWRRLVVSYRQLSKGKFIVLNEMEKYIPVSPFRTEWEVLKEGKDKKVYHPISVLEHGIPVSFIILHTVLAAYFIVHIIVTAKLF